MTEQKPSIGRIVHYRLTRADASKASLPRDGGNPHEAGQVLPLVVCRIFEDEYGPGVPGVNGQVLVDGRGSLWVTSIQEGEGEGQWSWPPRT